MCQRDGNPFLAVSGNTYRQYALVITGLPVIEITTTEAPAEEDGEGRYHIRVLSTDSAEGVVEFGCADACPGQHEPHLPE